MQKNCLFCGNLYTKGVNCSKKDWDIRRYCSRRCTNSAKVGKPSWNKGIKGSIKPNSGSFKKGEVRLLGNTNAKGHTPWNKGLPTSAETRKKISKTLTGKPTGRIGEKCIFWRGGTTAGRKKLKNTIEYKNWRRSVFERDKYTCQACGDRNYEGRGTTLELNPHHIKSVRDYPELSCEVSNGQTLCINCHRKTESWGRPRITQT